MSNAEPEGLILHCKQLPEDSEHYFLVTNFLQFSIAYAFKERREGFAFLAQELSLSKKAPRDVSQQFAVLNAPFLLGQTNAQKRYLPLHWGRIKVRLLDLYLFLIRNADNICA